LKVSLLTGGKDKPYVLGLLSAIVSNGIYVNFIGNDEMENAAIMKNKNVGYYNLRGDQSPHAPANKKIIRVLKYYLKLIIYAAKTESKLFHIIWLNKFIYFDRTLLNIYYKIIGKKLIYTVHNINMRERDGNDSIMNRLTLKFMYNIVDHIFVHTKKMKLQLIDDYNIDENKVTVIPFGINATVRNSELRKIQARHKLSLSNKEKIILFFGNIAPYKGLEYLVLALSQLKKKYNELILIIAGRIKECDEYWINIQSIIKRHSLENNIIKKIGYIPDEDVEIYFKAADVLIVPYKFIFQSGVVFLSYNFGLPVIATDVGSLKEDIVEGKTGFICRPGDPENLAKKIELYFQSDLYKNLEANRNKIIEYASKKYSWEKIGKKTKAIYNNLLASRGHP
jgi:D-inositol-3-phosphate glycosyltransferase